ncbi:hypothetical protein MSEO_29570 [Mycobacterium seoulense]|uniref:Enoyl-CoA hydratase n=1 Tax=Mycobacterium seoulense TaxID=386911 RepID=A0A7I7P3X3_9MYCO|nr:hypothetical protein MSEO_29570 [Mycobacterium seoulense]
MSHGFCGEARRSVHIVSINRREALNSVTEDVHHVFATNWKALDADDDAVPDEALALGERFAALPPRTLRVVEGGTEHAPCPAAQDVLEYAFAEKLTSFSTPEFKERVAAFRARTKK